MVGGRDRIEDMGRSVKGRKGKEGNEDDLSSRRGGNYGMM